jgi:hypothetical protein
MERRAMKVNVPAKPPRPIQTRGMRSDSGNRISPNVFPPFSNQFS